MGGLEDSLANVRIDETLSRYHALLADCARTYRCVSAASARPFDIGARAVSRLIKLHGLERVYADPADWAPNDYGNPENLIAESNALQQRMNVSRYEMKSLLTTEDDEVLPLMTAALRSDIESLDEDSIRHAMRCRQLAPRARIVQLRATVPPEYVAPFGEERFTARAVESVALLAREGVPAEYAHAVHPVYELTTMVAMRIITAYKAGISAEYVKAIA